MTSSSNTANTSGGIGFSGALFLLFLGLKLTHVITWSWWWIAAPLWGPIAIVTLLFALAGIATLVLKARNR